MALVAAIEHSATTIAQNAPFDCRCTIALPPLPGARGYAGETVELSHQLEGKLRVFRGDALLLALPLPLEEHAERRPKLLSSAQKRKATLPRIYNLSGRPALAAVT
jgi:hypothetical protein